MWHEVEMPPEALLVRDGEARLQRAAGEGRIAVCRRGNVTVLANLYEDGCARIRLPHTHSDTLQAVLMNTAGGLTGGDRLNWSAAAGGGTALTLTTPACERIYRSLGEPARIETKLEVAAGAHLDWLPQETILFEESFLERRLEVDLAPDASFTAVEAVLLGREAMGEAATAARFRDNWRVRRGGRLVHAEATILEGNQRERMSASLLAGARAFATVLHVSADAERRLEAVRALLSATAGASVVGERLTLRLLAANGLALRHALTPIIALLSSAGSIPRLWNL
jgi:urease accessory protein